LTRPQLGDFKLAIGDSVIKGIEGRYLLDGIGVIAKDNDV
jgi:hypothetical protein